MTVENHQKKKANVIFILSIPSVEIYPTLHFGYNWQFRGIAELSSFNFNSESIWIILLRPGTLAKEELNECGFVLDLSYTLIWLPKIVKIVPYRLFRS